MKTEETLYFSTDYSSKPIIVQNMACSYSQQLPVRAWRVLCLALFGSVCPNSGLVQHVFSHSEELLRRGCATDKTKQDDLSLLLLDHSASFVISAVLLGSQGAETVSSHLKCIIMFWIKAEIQRSCLYSYIASQGPSTTYNCT